MQVPIMLRSKYCQLEEQSEQDLTTLGECPLDQASRRHVTLRPAHMFSGQLALSCACKPPSCEAQRRGAWLQRRHCRACPVRHASMQGHLLLQAPLWPWEINSEHCRAVGIPGCHSSAQL